MKKLMTSTIILMPLLILAIMLVSGAIMSFVSHIYVESVEFVENDALVLVMDDETAPPQKQVDVNIFPLKAKNRDLVFTVENEEIAAVDANGTVTAKFYGETYVTVTSAENVAARAKRKIIVTDDRVHSLRMCAHPDSLYRDETLRLTVEVFPPEAKNAKVIWSSSDGSVLSVTPSGEVKALSRGTAVITATSEDSPEATATAKIECLLPLEGISADETPVVTALKRERFPEIAPVPAAAAYTTEYSSSDESVATVNETGEIEFAKAGAVTITATAKDGLGHTDSVSVRYDCTYGYYMGPLFTDRNYTFDYDEVKGMPLAELAFRSDPAGSDREIVGVSFDREGPIAFDSEAKRFIVKDVGDGTALGDVRVTVRARKYSKSTGAIREFEDDVCTVTLTRKTAKLSFIETNGDPIDSMSITVPDISMAELIGTDRPSSGIGVLAEPMNHTDALTYRLASGGECASLDGKTLRFTAPGLAVVEVAAGGVSARLTVSYAKLGEREVVVDQTRGAVALDFEAADSFMKGVLQFTTPSGYTAQCVSDNEEVVHVDETDGVFRLIPRKGGFADVTVSFLPASSAAAAAISEISEPSPFTVRVYVDRPVLAGDLAVTPADGSATSLDEIAYAVELSVAEDVMEGKELYVMGSKAEYSEEGGKIVFRSRASFGGSDDLIVTASVRYAASASFCDPEKTGEIVQKTCTVHSTHGNLSSRPEVTADGMGTEFGPSDNAVVFGNVGETVVLRIDTSLALPADFVLNPEKIALSGADGYLTYTVSTEGRIAEVTLRSVGASDKPISAVLTVAGQSFGLRVTADALADAIEVRYAGDPLAAGTAYKTFLDSLGFRVTLSRRDGIALTNAGKTVKYVFGGADGTAASDGNGNRFSFSVAAASEAKSLVIESGTARFECAIAKLSISETPVEFRIEFPQNGVIRVLDAFGYDDGDIEVIFPQAMQGSFDLVISPKEPIENLLGSLAESETREYFNLVSESGWEISFLISSDVKAKFTATVPEDAGEFYGERFTLHGQKDITLTFGRVSLASVEFARGDESFDSNSEKDVYPGYQQVRVFAKQSDYGGTVTDYVRIPLVALTDIAKNTPANPASLVLTLTKHCDAENGGIVLLTRQRGTKAEYGNEVYTIEPAEGGGPSKLKKGEQVIAENGKYSVSEADRVPWVDVYAEDNCAHLYFGNFGGLSETDIQNDYFGNFGEKPDWERVQTHEDDYDKSGRPFAPSANAFSYLRLEAGDGAMLSDVNAHFNFNVAEGGDLYNVFDAEGYYKHKKVVLQSDLYGPGELGDSGAPYQNAEEKGLFLDRIAELGKTLIYGNGYQVNLQAKTASLEKYSESDGIEIERAYNTVVKCANPTEEIGDTKQKMVLRMKYAYYCNLSYYYKFNPSSGGAFYTKSTVFSHIPKAAIQLYGNETVYAENIVFTESGTSIMADNKNALAPHIYFKGNLDILNYHNKSGLESFNPLVGAMFAEVVPNVQNYVEWHGRDLYVKANSAAADANTDKVYVNIALFGLASFTENMFVWNGTEYKKATETPLESGVKLVCRKLVPYTTPMGDLYAWTYDTLDEGGDRLDNADIGVDIYVNATLKADLSRLYAENRYIRLQCEFKAPGEKNYDHILWHMQEIYRDKSLIAGRKSHIADLKETLKGTTWFDGSYVDGEGEPHDPPAAAAAAALRSALLPKREYA